MRRGEVRWYSFPRPDKKRPVVILTRDSIIEYLNEVTVAPVTTTVREIPSEVHLGPSDGMPRTCAINCDHLQTVAKSRIGAVITRLGPDRLEELRHAVGFALNL